MALRLAAPVDVAPEPSPQDLQARLKDIVSLLDGEARKRVGQRPEREERWLRDLEQLHGQYDPATAASLAEKGGSQLFVNLTRQKANALEARLFDMLFPTDDRNWGIGPTPVPEMTIKAKQAAEQAAQAQIQLAEMPEGDPSRQGAQQAAQQAMQYAAQMQAIQDEARRRADAMQEEMDDQLRESDYQAECRKVIRDACRLGAGILKGPIKLAPRPRWRQQGDVYDLAYTAGSEARPGFERVDPWSFFPDMSARCMDECEGVFERHLMTAKDLRALARRDDIDPDAIRRILREGKPKNATASYLNSIRTITDAGQSVDTERYEVWEYRGSLPADQMRILAMWQGQEPDDIDPLDDVSVVIMFCQGELLMAGPGPLDSGELIYSVFPLEPDDATVFGFGVAYLMRDPQSSLNAAWRMLMDNAGLGVGPQIVVDRDSIEPENRDWNIRPCKLWFRKAGVATGPAFETYDIPTHQQELAAIIDMSVKFIDDETGVPMLAQGEQGPHVTKTLGGMSILANSANTIFRRIVKNFDDYLTVPTIRRLYDWNMQFSANDNIKGDYTVDARGSSVLLVREMQSANLMAVLLNFSGHPVLGPVTKVLPLYRKLMQSMMIPANEAVMTDEELREKEAAEAGQPPPPDPAIMKIEADLNRSQMEIDGKMALAAYERETALMIEAARMNTSLEKLQAQVAISDADREAQLLDSEADRQAQDRRQMVEAAVSAEIGPGGGGTF